MRGASLEQELRQSRTTFVPTLSPCAHDEGLYLSRFGRSMTYSAMRKEERGTPFSSACSSQLA
jgi:hypothetical protein